MGTTLKEPMRVMFLGAVLRSILGTRCWKKQDATDGNLNKLNDSCLDAAERVSHSGRSHCSAMLKLVSLPTISSFSPYFPSDSKANNAHNQRTQTTANKNLTKNASKEGGWVQKLKPPFTKEPQQNKARTTAVCLHACTHTYLHAGYNQQPAT